MAFSMSNAISAVSERLPFITSFRMGFCIPVSADSSLCFIPRADNSSLITSPACVVTNGTALLKLYLVIMMRYFNQFNVVIIMLSSEGALLNIN